MWWYIENLPALPVTLTIVLALPILWFVLWNWKFRIEAYAWNYERAFAHGEWWRGVTAALTHANVLHVLFNCVTLWFMGQMEAYLGSAWYCKDTFVLIAGEAALLAAMEHVLITRFGREAMRHTHTVGYSGVVFGWMAINSLVGDFGGFSVFGAFDVPKVVGPWISLVVTQLIIPNASLTGHLSGMAIGYVIGGLHAIDDGAYYEWFDNKLYAYCMVWAVIYFVYNVKSTVPECRYVSWLRIESDADVELSQIAVVNGVIARPPQRPRHNDDLV